MPIPRNKRRNSTDIYSKKKRSLIMGAVKGKDNLLELEFCKKLKRAGLRFSRNVSRLPGKPDVVFKNRELVIFLDGCFWHGCRKHFKLPKSNQIFWQSKIEGNMRRDKQINKFYKDMGWTVLRFWQHNITRNPNKLIDKIQKMLITTKYGQ
jgi:DNA mismatch endonuclease, patch repair protein